MKRGDDLVTRISMSELDRMLADVDVPDKDIAEFLTILPDESNPFNPIAVPDPEKVKATTPLEEFQAEAAVATGLVSFWARERRRRRFERDLPGNRKPLVYAEGDSWLQFPFLIEDVIDHLDQDHLVYCTSKPGDTLANMVFDRRRKEYVKELKKLLIDRRLPIKTFLFSGAGNDVVGKNAEGEAALSTIVKPYDPVQSIAWHIETQALVEKLAFIESAYIKVLTDIDDAFPALAFPDLRVVIHGYDYSPVRGVPSGDPHRPSYARDWTGEPLSQLGFPDNNIASGVVAALIDRLNDLTARVCGAFSRAVFADLRGAVPASHWADELHPTDAGFAAATQKLRTYL
jgi:hypothetical protein